ncbi:MAG: glycyl-radical enzyme activating protein [Bacteroidales bacterium]|nr:glycyl-radical enzyme activating protein [Bacteroidales bacterium]
MRGCIFDVRRFTLHDGPGIRTTVFFKGCPLACRWCHNPEGIGFEPVEWVQERLFDGRCIKERETIGHYVEARELLQTIKRDSDFYRVSGGGVSFSGGEPLAQPDFLLEILQLCREAGIHTCVDTSGYAAPEVFERILPYCDLLLLDLKHAIDDRHIAGTGQSNQPILLNINIIKNHATPVWLRLPMIPDYNMDNESWSRMLECLDRLRMEQIRQISLLPYHRTAAHKYPKCGMNDPTAGLKTVEKTDLQPYYDQLTAAGWKHVTIGG